MELSIMTLFLTLSAGMASVLSPCVLPVLPIILTGTEDDHRSRPLMIVAGLAITFILMGVITSLFASVVGEWMAHVEKGAAVLVIAFGILMILDINVFKKMSFFYKFQSTSKGTFSGLVMGLTLGLVWIPCIGPMLSSVLAMVATQGKLVTGIFLLLIYSVGFAIPMLIAGYATQFFRTKLRSVLSNPLPIRIGSGIILIAFGIYILFNGVIIL